ncbi:uncharacterized protein LOC120107502 [Phoenix dactylifera]|uniref:Uncharacterized protein LOC120107502 n=1 Tax=Phoenix dactylifera TaxID=42345 RepID=A0A8B8ZYU0_PHODC|nr:uncharacterized protein LOC120107502 [Phoenix dactylifera]
MLISTNTLLLLSANSHPNISFATNPTMASLLLFILLLSLSIGASDGRHLSVHDKDSNRAFHHSSKDAAIVKLAEETSATAKQTQSSSEKESRNSATMERPKDLEAPTKDAEARRDEVSGAVQIPSQVKVSWLVRRKGRRVHPGFDVDYMGPRTHPPSHN